MSQPLPSPWLEPPPVDKLPPHQEAMVEACQVGQIADLQRLFDDHDIKSGDDPVTYRNAEHEAAPMTAKLFVAAISHGHQSIVQYLYSVYPKFDFSREEIVIAITQKPDIEMFKLIYSYSPEVIDFMCDDYHTTVLNRACEGGPQYAGFINCLLDHGATTGGFGSVMYHLGEELLPAMQYKQPIEIIERLIPMTSQLWLPINMALEQKRADVLEVLLRAEYARPENASDISYAQSLLTKAKVTEEKKVIAVVERYVRNSEKRARKSSEKELQSTKTRKWWWQRALPAETKEKAESTGSSVSTPTGGPAKSWWPLSMVQNKPKPSNSHEKGKDFDDSASDST